MNISVKQSEVKIIILIISFFSLLISGNAQSTITSLIDQQAVNESLTENDSITFKTFGSDSGWGYDIYINGILYIHQPNIPAVIGNSGFSKEEFAVKTALFVIEKIKKQIIPPSVSKAELDSLNVLN